MEQRCVQLFGNEWKKILQCHYTLCQAYLFPRRAFVFKGWFSFFLFFFFWLDFESKKMAVELSFGSSVRVLKLDSCTNQSVSASCLCLLILSWRTARCTAVPPWNLWFIQGGTILTKYRKRLLLTANDWQLGVADATENPPDNSRLRNLEQRHTVLGTITMETHAKKGELGSSEKNGKLKKRLVFLFHLDSWGKTGP